MKKHIQYYGPGLNRSSHIINKAIQGEDLVGFLNFFAWLIGCESPCRESYLNRIEIDRKYDERWTYRAHNEVNRRLGKYQPTWEEAQDIRMKDFMETMEPGVWLFLLYYSKLMYSERCIDLFKYFFPFFLDEAPETWRCYYDSNPVAGDFYQWMKSFYSSVSTLHFDLSVDDAVLSYGGLICTENA